MITQNEITELVKSQALKLKSQKNVVSRELQETITVTPSFALIISGIRRCGKSTLQMNMANADGENSFYLNFDTPLFYGFETADFKILDKVIQSSSKKMLYFDEIQIVKGWESYIRQKLDEEFKVVVTGSNATMLSKELGTRLTGRHVSKELFPFSYREFLAFKKLQSTGKSMEMYLKQGGFPEFLKTNDGEVHVNLVEDIIYRDIAVRFQVRDVRILKNMVLYLISNVGTLVSATKLKQVFGIRSTTTLMEYFSYTEQTYLLGFVPKFSYSIKSQIINPRKVFCIDTGIIHSLSRSFSKNAGHILENAVFLELRRKFKDIYYFNENQSECDFVVFEKNQCKCVIQVCHELNDENTQREFKGATEAARFFNLQKATVVTLNQNDFTILQGITLEIITSVDFFSGVSTGDTDNLKI
jgi:predicted AAA+ superfamily ATPase